MSYRSGHEINRNAVETYNGFSIIRRTEKFYHANPWGSGFCKDWVEDKTISFTFCPIGEEKHPSSDYLISENSKDGVKKRIDSMLDGKEIILTHGEFTKYVKSPNKKNDYLFTLQDLIKLMKNHQKGDAKTKYIIEERLTDANYHEEHDLISEEQYDEFEAFVLKRHALKEKFEVYTFTEDVKRIKNPKQFEEGLAKVIADYLANQGVKDTSVKVNFIENW